jgi:hypothetical protein
MKATSRLFSFALFALLFTSCGEKKGVAETESALPTWQDGDIILTYERTPCFGRCPHFEFTVWGSGKCRYVGKNFVDRLGSFSGKIDVRELETIFSKAREIGYENFESVYDNRMVTDLPSVSTGIWLSDSLQTVRNRYKGPQEIQTIYPLFDQLVESIEWNKLEDN